VLQSGLLLVSRCAATNWQATNYI